MRPNSKIFKMLLVLKMYLVLEVLVSVLSSLVAMHLDDLADMSHFTVVENHRISLLAGGICVGDQSQGDL